MEIQTIVEKVANWLVIIAPSLTAIITIIAGMVKLKNQAKSKIDEADSKTLKAQEDLASTKKELAKVNSRLKSVENILLKMKGE